MDNLLLADKKASRGKSSQKGVILHREDKENNLLNLQQQLLNKTYNTSDYSVFIIKEPKERIIHRLPYIDRVVHHAIVTVIGKMLLSTLTTDTYSCIPGRGIHLASYKLRKVIGGG